MSTTFTTRVKGKETEIHGLAGEDIRWETTEVDAAEVKAVTDKALLIDFSFDLDAEESLWVPKSAIKSATKNNGEGFTLEVAAWWADKNL